MKDALLDQNNSLGVEALAGEDSGKTNKLGVTT